MKSLVALLDRKKRPNTLVPTPLPSSLPPTVSARQERLAPLSSRHTLSSDFPQHRATSNPNLAQRPHLYESARHPRVRSPVQSVAYHSDPDDDTLIDPFAASSPMKPSRAPPPTLFHPVSVPAHRDYDPNPTTPALQDVFRNPQPVQNAWYERNSSLALRTASQTSSQTGAESNETVSAPAHDVPGKGRWLRERRSLSNFLRPQAAISTGPVPQLPPFPVISERKSSFFKRGRSGSTPVAPQRAERAHTSHPLSTAPVSVPVQSETPSAPRLRSVNKETTRPAPTATLESWARDGRVSRDQSSPSSPTNTRRRALSAPARPPRPTEPVPPIPAPQPVPSRSPSEFDMSKVASDQFSPVFRPEVPNNRQARPRCSARAPEAGSVSVPNSHDPGCAPLGSNLRRRPSLKHIKRLSVSGSEGGHGADPAASTNRVVRKSALRHTLAQIRHGSHSRQDSRVAVTEGLVIGATSVSQLPTPHQGVSDSLPNTDVGEHRRPVGGIIQATLSAARANDTSVGGSPSASGVTPIGNIVGGRAPNDSRALPVLDNVWGSFVSETAFGSLPSSPNGSIVARNRTANLSRPVPRRRTIECPSSPESPRGLSRRRQWSSALPPPSSPPGVKLPPLPVEQPPAMALSFGSVIRRKLSRCPNRRDMLFTPPISPLEETEIRGLGVTPSTSASGNSLLASSCNSSSVSSMGSRDLPPLRRSTSSPVVRSPASPVLGAAPDTSDRSWLSVDPPCLRATSPSSTSQSGSQCTPVPGTPIASPISAEDPYLTYFGASRGVLDSVLSISLSESAHVRVSSESVQKVGLRPPPPSVPVEGSEISLSMFPAVPAGTPEPYGRREVERGEVLPTNWSEEPLPTPPVTPAWFAQAFDARSGNEQGCVNVGEAGNKIPLTHTGNLARMRRKHAQNTPSGSSNESSSDGAWGLAYLRRRPGPIGGSRI